MAIFRAALLLVSLLALAPTPTMADPPTNPISTFDTAKKRARDNVYFDHRITLYCACPYEHSSSASGGAIQPLACGYEPRAGPERGAQLEWEHMMPAFEFGHLRVCWRVGHDDCRTADGTHFKGRKCCEKTGVDQEFRHMEADLHNLAPSVGELNGERLNHPYGIVKDEPRDYGACDFELGGDPKVAEPMESIRGDVARAWLYMSETYNVRLSQQERAMFEAWHAADPVSEWERTRDDRINMEQGNRNPWVGQ